MKENMNRRDFLFRLGAGSCLAITGFFIYDAISQGNERIIPTGEEPLSALPEISATIKMSYEKGSLLLNGKHSTCYVNKTGEKIISLLDGKHTVQGLASEIADHYSITHSDELETSIAGFICQLGASGFLTSPFYVTMYENY